MNKLWERKSIKINEIIFLKLNLSSWMEWTSLYWEKCENWVTQLAGSGIIGPKPGDATRTGGTLGHLQDPVSGPELLLLSADTPASLENQDGSGKAVGAWAESPALEIKMRKGHHLSSLEKRDAHCVADVSFHPPLCSERLQHLVEMLQHDHPQRLLLPASCCPDYPSLVWIVLAC